MKTLFMQMSGGPQAQANQIPTGTNIIRMSRREMARTQD